MMIPVSYTHLDVYKRQHTLQIGDNNQIVARTGITVVGDFRRRDIALGGQGAPLVPAFHHALLAHSTERRMVLNIGGIANLSPVSYTHLDVYKRQLQY